MPSVASLGIFAAAATLAFRPAKQILSDNLTHHPPAAGWLLLLGLVAFAAAKWNAEARSLARFAWACFLAPLGKEGGQKGRLDRFYRSQAEVYDATRNRLLRGRRTMLKLSVAHLLEARRRQPGRRLVWVDIGGGTGWNIEAMDAFCPISTFDAVYLIDLCEPLLEVARKRFAARGWKNVHVLCQDATQFVLPEWTETSQPASLDFVTMSYSLSMIPNFYGVIDRIERFLAPDGLLSVVDFYVSGRERAPWGQLVGDFGRHCGWLSRLFWLHWFEFDHVDLHPSRRAYLEFKFGTLKSVNARNSFVPFFVQIPYYIGVFTRADKDVSKAVQAFEIDGGNFVSTPSASPVLTASPGNSTTTTSPATPFNAAVKHTEFVEDTTAFSLGASALPLPDKNSSSLSRSSSRNSRSVRLDVSTPLSSFHYQLHKHYRLPYLTQAVHDDFNLMGSPTWIYGFTWEDPFEDMKHLGVGPDDDVLAITSAGDNLLHYAVAARPRRLHCVDMNPAQNALLELKLASICALSYDDFWQMFGLGRHPNFRDLLDMKISPYLSSHAYQFWRANATAFDNNFFMHGFSGYALRIVKWALWIAGVGKHVEKMCDAPTLEEQRKIWKEKIMPVMTSKLMTALVSNPVFMWKALGVPMNQARMFLNETTPLQYAIDTLDPVASTEHMSQGSYWYYLCLMQRYTKASRPLYLTPEGFALLKKDGAALVDHFRLHTDALFNVLKQLSPGSLSVAVIMDAQDWFDPSSEAGKGHPDLPAVQSITAKPEKPCQLTLTVMEFHRVLRPGGRVFFRSAAMSPWYTKIYQREGFEVEPLGVRTVGTEKPIDGVNMYASFWKATKQ